ncbi:MAG: SpoIID/LytB domain-containing protein [Elusimicrobia bacterium]|nr:SpoIID/LytB domain-containing protein [Elusimicrobiota bacterium]
MKIKGLLWTGGVLAGFIALCIPADCRRLPETIIRVSIITDADKINLGCEGDYAVYALNDGEKKQFTGENICLVQPFSGGILFDDMKVLSGGVRIVPGDGAGSIRINGRRYRDSVLIKKNRKGKLNVINELGIESYLAGVLPHEVNPAWDMEALKAQAVVSRTYAMSNLGKHKDDGHDLCNKVHCQVYAGAEGENSRTNRAVELTRGEVVTYKGNLISAVYHASCGGHTENPKYVWSWGGNVPEYLYGVRDRYCVASPHFRWTKDVKEDFIIKKMETADYKDIRGIVSIIPGKKNNSGRNAAFFIKYIKKTGGTATLNVRAARFRLIVDPWLIKSTKLDFIKKIDKNTFRFSGYGWGHGVGMCQWGAKHLSEKGWNYKKIIHFYYHGTKVDTWEE